MAWKADNETMGTRPNFRRPVCWSAARLALVCLLGAFVVLPAVATAAGPESLERLPPPGAPAWTDQIFRRIPHHTRYEVVTATPGDASTRVPAYLATSECAASGKLLPTDHIDLDRTPFLGWSWKIVRGLDVIAEQSAAGDDFAARVYVLFAFDPENASLRERIEHGIASSLLARSSPGAALNYVFASRIAIGTTWPNPSQPRARMLALRTGSSVAARPLESPDGWHHESVDIRADYARYVSPTGSPRVVAIAIMTDADDTCGRASALYADFCFSSESRPGCDASD